MLKLELKNLVSEWLSRFVQSPDISVGEARSIDHDTRLIYRARNLMKVAREVSDFLHN